MIGFAFMLAVGATVIDPEIMQVMNGPIAFGVLWLMNRLNQVDKRLTRIETVLEVDKKSKLE